MPSLAAFRASPSSAVILPSATAFARTRVAIANAPIKSAVATVLATTIRAVRLGLRSGTDIAPVAPSGAAPSFSSAW